MKPEDIEKMTEGIKKKKAIEDFVEEIKKLSFKPNGQVVEPQFK